MSPWRAGQWRLGNSRHFAEVKSAFISCVQTAMEISCPKPFPLIFSFIYSFCQCKKVTGFDAPKQAVEQSEKKISSYQPLKCKTWLETDFTTVTFFYRTMVSDMYIRPKSERNLEPRTKRKYTKVVFSRYSTYGYAILF
jgi:hypothetical protein